MNFAVPSVHSVQFYDESSALIERLCGIVGSGLKVGESVLIVATAFHRLELVKQLESSGIEVRDFAREGRFTMFDAEETLSTFMRAGRPDPGLFIRSVGSLVVGAKKVSARSSGNGLTVFGEMVAVLWDRGEKEAALELENLWNDLLNSRAFHLHCAYPRKLVSNGNDSHIAEICSRHSHVLDELHLKIA